MILTGKEISKELKTGRIHINPFVSDYIGTNSYDFRLGRKLRYYSKEILDSQKFNQFIETEIPEEGFVLEPDKIYLGHSMEEMGSDFYTPLIQAKSSLGRLGLSICLNSGIGDIGFSRQWTLLLYTPQPLRIYPGMAIGQIYFFQTKGEIELYQGAYLNAAGPTVSQAWRLTNKKPAGFVTRG